MFPVSSLDYFPPNPELEVAYTETSSSLIMMITIIIITTTDNSSALNGAGTSAADNFEIVIIYVVVAVVFSLKLVLLIDRLMRYLIAGHREFYMEYCRVLLDLNRVAEKKIRFFAALHAL